jgi:hypothetical protein
MAYMAVAAYGVSAVALLVVAVLEWSWWPGVALLIIFGPLIALSALAVYLSRSSAWFVRYQCQRIGEGTPVRAWWDWRV